MLCLETDIKASLNYMCTKCDYDISSVKRNRHLMLTQRINKSFLCTKDFLYLAFYFPFKLHFSHCRSILQCECGQQNSKIGYVSDWADSIQGLV